MTQQGIEQWQHLHRQLRRQWWVYLVIALIGLFFFIRNLPPHEPYSFAILMLIPILSLRQAWKIDRQIVACNRQLADAADDSNQPDRPEQSGDPAVAATK